MNEVFQHLYFGEQGTRKEYSFEEQGEEYELPIDLKIHIDAMKRRTGIHSYLFILHHVASEQQETYQLVNNVLSPSHSIDEIVKMSLAADKGECCYEGIRGMEKATEAREYYFDLHGTESMERLEGLLGVDSKGFDAGDEWPLIGVELHLTDVALVYSLTHNNENEHLKELYECFFN